MKPETRCNDHVNITNTATCVCALKKNHDGNHMVVLIDQFGRLVTITWTDKGD